MKLVEYINPSMNTMTPSIYKDHSIFPHIEGVVDWYDCPKRMMRIFRCSKKPIRKGIHLLYGIGEFVKLAEESK